LKKRRWQISYQDGNYRDLFVDRVMFPIFDTRSRAVGFGGRIWKVVKDAPKYINSLEIRLQQTQPVLWNKFFP